MKPTKDFIETQVKEALADKFIKNVDYENAKHWANYLIEKDSDQNIRIPCYEISESNDDKRREDAYMIVSEFGVSGVYEVPSKLKKLAAWKSKPHKVINDWNRPYCAEMMPLVEKFLEEWKQLALDFAALKPYVVKGRVKQDKPKPEPKSPIGTCQICQEPHCLMGNGLIYLHGYQRPGDGFTVGSCDGASYLPYEKSCDRIKEIKLSYESSIASLMQNLQRFESNSVKKLYHAKVKKDICPGDPNWEKLCLTIEGEIRFQMSMLKAEVERFEELIKKWRPSKIKNCHLTLGQNDN